MDTASVAKLIETHSGVVVLCGERAYKIKKPIVTGFLDFGSPQRRETACAREVELNRRLSPDVYLGVGHLSDPGGGPAEPVVVMHRMPEGRRLSVLADHGAIGREELRGLARMLEYFHAHARRTQAIDREATTDALRRRWRANLTELQSLSEGLLTSEHLSRLDALAMRYLAGRNALFEHRIRSLRIVDGHGDLLAEDIFLLPSGFRVLDCLEFDDTLRYLDCTDDVAFLAMDLESRGHGDLARILVEEYVSAEADPAPPSLWHYYIAYRALVRAKVGYLRFHQELVDTTDEARAHLDIAGDHLNRGAIRLCLVGGLPGSGKTTIARELAARTGAKLISSDEIRRGLRDRGSITGPPGILDDGRYTPAAKALVYRTIREQARAQLLAGRSVVLDASWISHEERRRATGLARDTYANLIAFDCQANRTVTDARLAERVDSPSEATTDIAHAMARAQAPWGDSVVLDTERPVEQTLDTALATWFRATHDLCCSAAVAGVT